MRKIFKKFVSVFCLSLILLLVGCGTPAVYPEEKSVYVRNPDCGFYQPIGVNMTEDGIKSAIDSLLSRNNLVHLRVSLKNFSSGEAITVPALDGLKGLLERLRTSSVNAVIRFAYDGFNGIADCEPALEKILAHINQLGAVLSDYPDVLTAIEAGMIGPWGEMHTSLLAGKDTFNAVIAEWLSCTALPLPVLVRRPKFAADYLGVKVTELKDLDIEPQSEGYRIGVFNDGYLGSATDLGTYSDREKEIAWLNKQAAHTPFGGEVTVPDSSFNKIEYAAKEMFQTHTSYLNELWNDKVIAEWKSTKYTAAAGSDAAYYGKSAYDYIRDHLGYRFTLKELRLPDKAKKKLKFSFKVLSDGFGNLLKPKKCEIVFKSDNADYAFPIDLNPVKWLCGGTYDNAVTLDLSSLPQGEYTVFLRMREPSQQQVLYSVAFSNGLFDESVLANRLGQVTVTR